MTSSWQRVSLRRIVAPSGMQLASDTGCLPATAIHPRTIRTAQHVTTFRRTGTRVHAQAARDDERGWRVGPLHRERLSAEHEVARRDPAAREPETDRRGHPPARALDHERAAARGVRA